MSSGISVIICCYNSAARITDTLKYLARQKKPNNLPTEVILVDNNCIDDTIAVAKACWLKYETDITLTVITEQMPGLSFARKRGVMAAAYEYLVFCDDDNWLDEDYLSTAYRLLDEKPEYAAIGGRSDAAFENEKSVPAWFYKYMLNYAVGRQAEHSSDVTTRGFLWGAGMAIRKSLFIDVCNEQFPLLLSDRKGNDLASGGDSEICLRFILKGYKLYYDDRLHFRHFIPGSRLTDSYRVRLFRGFEESCILLNKYYLFIKNYINNPHVTKTIMRTHFKYWLSRFGIIKIPHSNLWLQHISIFTNYMHEYMDADLRFIRKMHLSFHKKHPGRQGYID